MRLLTLRIKYQIYLEASSPEKSSTWYIYIVENLRDLDFEHSGIAGWIFTRIKIDAWLPLVDRGLFMEFAGALVCPAHC